VSFVLCISPAKKMNVVEGPPYVEGSPRFLDRTRELLGALRDLGYEEAKALWKCSDALAQLNYDRLQTMDLEGPLTAACVAYEGIQYQHLAAQVMSEADLAYLGSHLRILSGFYGVLSPFDGVVPYRLEMQARLVMPGAKNLYEYWGPSLAESVAQEADTLVNVASVEYAKAVVPHAERLGMKVLTCTFGVVRDGRLRQPSTEAKAARGVFCRWCAESGVEEASELGAFSERGYALVEGRSDEGHLVFVKGE